MDVLIKESVATLFCHAIKLDNKEMKIEQPIFCRFMGQDFDCNSEEAKKLLAETMQKDEGNIDTHISIITNALHNEPYKKMNLLKQLNHIIFRSKMRDEDYEFFDRVKQSFFAR